MRKFFSVLLTLVLAGAVGVSAYLLEGKLSEYRKEYDTRVTRTTEMRKGRTVDFEKLKATNSDVKGWIWLNGTNIDYPIVQGEDNDYYLHRDLDGSYLYDGCIFIDAAVEDPFSSNENTVIYGHHMMSGAMFHDLSKYIREDDFMETHDTIVIETETGSYDLKVVAYCNESADSNLYTTWFSDSKGAMSKSDFISLVNSKAKKLSGYPFDESDTFVTLSTCAYNYGDARHQIIGVLENAATKEVVTEEHISTFNKWLALQIAVGAIAAIVILSSVVGLFRRR